MEWIFGIVLAVIFIGVVWMSGESGECPHCGEDTVEVGYNGWKRKCMHCDWKNHD